MKFVFCYKSKCLLSLLLLSSYDAMWTASEKLNAVLTCVLFIIALKPIKMCYVMITKRRSEIIILNCYY